MPSAPHGEEAGQAESNAPEHGSVGALLRASRIRLGIDLEAVAETLCIRRVYLESIEEGRYDALPGGTYAVGFIRSYAEQLGLDPIELVRRFKLETTPEEALQPQPVDFPQPVKTLGLPLGAIFTGIVVVAALVGGAWYLLSGSGSASLLPRIPAALNEKVGDAPAPEIPVAEVEKPAPAPMQAEPSESETPKAEAVQPEPMKAEPDEVKPAPKPETPKPVPPKAEAPKSEPPKPVPPKVEPPKPEPVKPVATAPAPKPEPPKAVTPKAETAKPVPAPQPPKAPTVTPPAEPAAVADAGPQEPRVYGGENAGARIEIVATGESWVQVTEGDTLVLTRLLRAGDRFMVPNRPGLLLMTGNAGGLEVLVDGVKAPPLGSTGQVMRDVALNPDRLRSGR